MLGAQRQHVAEPLGIGIAGRELAQGRRAEDGMIGELENAADRFAGAEIGIEDGRHFLLPRPAEHCPQAFEPAYIAQHRVGFLDALERQPAGARRHARVALAHDQPLALVVYNDGRGRRAGPLEALDIAHVHPLRLQAGADRVAGGIVAGAAPQLGLAAEPGDGDRRVGSHAAAGLDMLERAHLRRLRRKRLNPVDAVERGMSHANDALRRWHSSIRA